MFTTKTTFESGLRRALYLSLFLIFGTAATESTAQTVDIGPNQYAFRYTLSPNFGLFFNTSDQQYEFRNGSAVPVFAFDAQNGRMKTDLEFHSSSDYLVPNNRYAFRAKSNPNFGLFFNASAQSYQFRNSSASSVFSVSASDGSMNTSGSISANGTVSASGGSSNQWNQAFNWGNHASAGYITSENDPKIGAMTTDAVPRWNGTQLVPSNMISTSSFNQITASNASLRLNSTGFLGGTSSLGFYNSGSKNGEIAYLLGQMHLNNQFELGEIWFSTDSQIRMKIGAEGEVAVNADPEANKNFKVVRDASGGRAIEAEVTFTGNNDVRGIWSRSVTNDGYGVGIEGRGGWRGMWGIAEGGSYTGTSVGVYGQATGNSSGTRIGVYGLASGGNTNWASYFVGNSYVSGDLRVGTTSGASGYKVSVNGKIMCTELRVQTVNNWPDYVFGEDYALLPLDELENFIRTEKHLPNIPSAAEMEEEAGFDIGEMQRLTLEKVEELTLYILELKRENEALKARIDAIEK